MDEDGGEPGERAPFHSRLSEGWQRFLARVIDHALRSGRRTAADLVRHFPPVILMRSLAREPAVRAKVLAACTGTKAKVALKKSAESAAHDIQIALDERETAPETLVALLDPDLCVRRLDRHALWRYATEDAFWKTERKNGRAYARAASHVAHILETALEEALLEPRAIIEGVSMRKLAELLPRESLHDVIASALAASREERPFRERDLVAACTPAVLADHVPLAVLWERIVVPYVVERHGFVPRPLAADESALDLEVDVVLGAFRLDPRAGVN
jgi:hypothetical protein